VRHQHIGNGFEVEDVVEVVRRNYAHRVVFHNGQVELAPGVWLEPTPGHTVGQQAVRLHTQNFIRRRGKGLKVSSPGSICRRRKTPSSRRRELPNLDAHIGALHFGVAEQVPPEAGFDDGAAL
jgi:hypothetical protein